MLKKYIIWEIGISLFIFILLFILALSDIINFAILIGGGVLIIVVGLITWYIVIIRKKKDEDKEVVQKVMSKETAESLSKDILYDLNILEYEKEVYESDIRKEGNNDTPIYVRTIRGMFEGKVISIIINMIDKVKGIKIYDDTLIDGKEIDEDINRRANRISQSPLRRDTRTTETTGPLLQTKQIIREEFLKVKDEEKDKKEGFK